jgi:hypothetical protein
LRESGTRNEARASHSHNAMTNAGKPDLSVDIYQHVKPCFGTWL